MTDPRLPVLAALLQQGRTLHLTTAILTLGVWGLAGWTLIALAAALFVVETWFAARVGLDAALFQRLGDGWSVSEMDRGLLGIGLVKTTVARTLDDRIRGARRLWRMQLLLVVVQGGLLALTLIFWMGA